MKARRSAKGGSRETALEIYTRMSEQSGDPKVKDMARRRILQIYSLDQRDTIRKVLAAYRERTGHCPSSWRELGTLLRTLRFSLNDSGAPLDPAGTAYVLRDSCDVDLDPKSEIPNN